MKLLRSKAMKTMLQRGVRKTYGKRPPHDGYLISLVYKTLRNGWHYQVEWINDTRFDPKPKIVVYAFAPPRDFSARSATHYLEA